MDPQNHTRVEPVTIQINTYDPAGRYDLDDEQARDLFSFMEDLATEAGYQVEFVETPSSVDEYSEWFTKRCFNRWQTLQAADIRGSSDTVAKTIGGGI